MIAWLCYSRVSYVLTDAKRKKYLDFMCMTFEINVQLVCVFIRLILHASEIMGETFLCELIVK